MDVFLTFDIFLHFLSGLATLFTGLFLWKNFKEDFENRTLGGILGFTSLIFFMMFFRAVFWGLGWIGNKQALNFFFAEYIIILFFLLLFGLPRFLYLVFNRLSAIKAGSIFGGILYLVYLVVHFSHKEEIISHYVPQGLVFELPFEEKIFLMGAIAPLLLIMVYRTIVHFRRWRGTKRFSYRFLNYLLMFFIFLTSTFALIPRFQPWQSVLGFLLMFAGVLGIYIVSSQEVMEREK